MYTPYVPNMIALQFTKIVSPGVNLREPEEKEQL